MTNNLQKIKDAYDNRDLEALKLLATPVKREINKRVNFRSALMLSCNKLEHLLKIDVLEADCLILNLEDGVSVEDKPFALVLCAIFLSHHKRCDKMLVVRINELSCSGYDEIAYLNQFMPDAIRIPKIRDPLEVESVCKLLKNEIDLHLSIETKEAWKNLSLLGVNKKVTTFYLGILDFFADIGMPQTLIKIDNPTLLYMLAHFLITCRSMDIKPVSFVFQEFKNLELFKSWISLEKEMGYSAKGCISPTQAKIVNDSFLVTDQEKIVAQKIVQLFELNAKRGITGFVDEDLGFIDEPIYKGALVIMSDLRH